MTLTDPDGAIALLFTAFSTELNYDLVTVYQGPGTDGGVLWSNSGDLSSQLPVLVTCALSCLLARCRGHGPTGMHHLVHVEVVSACNDGCTVLRRHNLRHPQTPSGSLHSTHAATIFEGNSCIFLTLRLLVLSYSSQLPLQRAST